MQRALFVFAKLNPGLTYVQGMNELFAPLYYTFRTDTEDDAREAAEADSFWCFVELMTEFRDNYCKQLVPLHDPLPPLPRKSFMFRSHNTTTAHNSRPSPPCPPPGPPFSHGLLCQSSPPPKQRWTVSGEMPCDVQGFNFPRLFAPTEFPIPWFQDNSDQGIKAALARLSKLLQKVDPELHDHLEHKTKVRPSRAHRPFPHAAIPEKRR